MRIKITLLLFLVVLVYSCKKQDVKHKPIEPVDTTAVLKSFAFPDSLNPSSYLGKTIIATIDGSTIHIALSDSVDTTGLIATFNFVGASVFIDSVEQESGVTSNDFTKPVTYSVQAGDGSRKDYKVEIKWLPTVSVDDTDYGIPHIYIYTDNKAAITSKENYVHGYLVIDGEGQYDDYQGTMKIRGRGKTSWGFRKKPYKIKLDNKAPLFGLYSHTKWILLANWRIGNLLGNAIPYETARLLGMPYTNHMIPAVVTLNGDFLGFYDFTEYKQVKKGRIDVGEDGLLLEMDYDIDKKWYFSSKYYHMGVMIKYPDITDSSEFKQIKNDYTIFERLIADTSFPDNEYLDYFSDAAFIDYMIVYNLTDNEEINHVKSTYINQKKGGKYRMGIVWDFDSGFGFVGHGGTHFKMNTATTSLFWSSPASGTDFFGKIIGDPHMIALYKERWIWFRNNKYQDLRNYVIQYASKTKGVFDKEHKRWGLRGSSGDWNKDLQEVLDWMDARATYMDSHVPGL